MILNKTNYLVKSFLVIILLLFFSNIINAQENEELKKIQLKIENINKDLKTLENAFYKTSEIKSSTTSSNSLNEDILTRHLLKLNEIEEQFREVTNKYEEINFKIDKLSNRITKIQSDNQMRFNDLENVNITSQAPTKKKRLQTINQSNIYIYT